MRLGSGDGEAVQALFRVPLRVLLQRGARGGALEGGAPAGVQRAAGRTRGAGRGKQGGAARLSRCSSDCPRFEPLCNAQHLASLTRFFFLQRLVWGFRYECWFRLKVSRQKNTS